MLQKLQNSRHVVKYYSYWVEGELEQRYKDWVEVDRLAPTDANGGQGQGREENEDEYAMDSSNNVKVPPALDRTFFFIHMEFCDATLRTWMNVNPERSLDQVNNIMSQILEGLKFIHSSEYGVIHRDLKPNNVFLNYLPDSGVGLGDVHVKIGDFGLARVANFDENSVTRAAVGCYYYRSPEIQNATFEMVQGESRYLLKVVYDNKTDIYSLGLIYFELVHPFRVSENEGFFRIIQRGDTRPFTIIADKYHRERELIKKMVRFNPAERPSAEEALTMLQTDQATFDLERAPFDMSVLQAALQDVTEHPQTAFSIEVVLDGLDAMPDLIEFAQQVQAALEHWFPIISAYLQSPSLQPTRRLVLNFDPKFTEATASSSNDIMRVNGTYIRENQDVHGIKVLLSTAVFSIQKYNTDPRPPVWLRDGIASYCSHYIYDYEDGVGAEPIRKPLAHEHYTRYGDSAAYLLNYINTNYRNRFGGERADVGVGGPDIIQAANWLSRDGKFNEDSFWINATGKTVGEWWNDMLIQG